MKKKNFNPPLPFKVVAVLAMLSAISIICGKYLAIRGGDILRFSFENLPIIFAGLAFGPVAGVLVGAVADLVGCVMVGYSINPLVTVGAVVIGAVSGLSGMLAKRLGFKCTATVIIATLLSHLLGSVIVKTFGLAVYYDMPIFVLMLWRLLNYVIVGGVECALLVVLLKNKEVSRLIADMKPRKKKEENAR